MCLSASVQAVAERLLRAIGRPDLIADPRFATNEARVRNDDVLDPIVAAVVADMSQEEALADRGEPARAVAALRLTARAAGVVPLGFARTIGDYADLDALGHSIAEA